MLSFQGKLHRLLFAQLVPGPQPVKQLETKVAPE